MDHHNQHWMYQTPPPQTTWTPPQTRGVKRTISESDCDDAYSEASSKDHTSPGDSDSCQMMSRKKRRGVIEKKRRDKINCSLSELKRLVPAAYEKQGSAKLEKAEILQLTVDHLKSLHAKGGSDAFSYDHQRFALDYHITGFRECISELARFLANEGMEDRVRNRLITHLQGFMTQRELSARNTTTMQPPGYATYPPPFPPMYPSTSQQTYQPQGYPHQSISPIPITQADSTTPTHSYATRASSHYPHHHPHMVNYQTTPSTPVVVTAAESTHVDHHQGTTYLELTNAQTPRGYTSVPFSSADSYAAAQGGYNNNSSKPYRPWGAEMAY